MKKILAIGLMLLFSKTGIAQSTGFFDDFNDITGWTGATGITLSDPSGTEMKVDASNIGSTYQSFNYSFSTLDLTNYPYIQVKIKANANSIVRIDFRDASGKVTNTTPTSFTVAGNSNYSWFTYDLTGKFSQSYPTNQAGAVDQTQITGISVLLNPGGNPNFTGTLYFDSLKIGSECSIPPPPKDIRINQIGFYPNETKTAISVQTVKDSFYVVSSNKQDTLFRGKLGASAKWTYSGETVRAADFTSFTTPGSYYLTTDSLYSFPFSIKDLIHQEVGKGLLKSYYYNRASMEITAPWGGKWARAEGHPDDAVYIDQSADTPHLPAGSIISSPKGWYDAGDYNKYTVNAGITVYSILAAYEHFPSYFDTLNTNIPESGNNIPDILDEVLWELRWLLTTQDPVDGAVYHKITDAKFDGTEMPSSDLKTRYAVYRGTAATLDFAAVMAQAYRVFSKFKTELPDFADSCLQASFKAYNWAQANPSVTVTGNPTGISTGTYSDNNLSDEFNWANMELYATTRDDKYYNHSFATLNYYNPGWANVNTLGLITLVNQRRQLNTAGYNDTTSLMLKLLNLAKGYKTYSASSPYLVSMGQSSYDFNWGSNSNAGFQGLIMLQAFRMIGDSSYLKAAIADLDYLLGRNGTGYSFITGYGSMPSMNPHHRISEADGVSDPVPGLVVGGANPGQDDGCVGYTSSYPASSYMDSFCSYSTNEPAINYTAPVAYLATGIEAALQNASYTPPYTTPVVISSVKNTSSTIISSRVYPNPAKGKVTVEFENKGTAKLSLSDATGKIVIQDVISENGSISKTLNTEGLNQGIYFLNISNNIGIVTEKIIIQ